MYAIVQMNCTTRSSFGISICARVHATRFGPIMSADVVDKREAAKQSLAALMAMTGFQAPSSASAEPSGVASLKRSSAANEFDEEFDEEPDDIDGSATEASQGSDGASMPSAAPRVEPLLPSFPKPASKAAMGILPPWRLNAAPRRQIIHHRNTRALRSQMSHRRINPDRRQRRGWKTFPFASRLTRVFCLLVMARGRIGMIRFRSRWRR